MALVFQPPTAQSDILRIWASVTSGFHRSHPPDISTSTTLDGRVLSSRRVPTPPPYPKDETGMVGIPCAVEKDELRPKPPPADEDGQAYGPGNPDKWADSMLNVDERRSRIARIIDWAECRGRLYLLWMKWIGSQGF